MKKIKVAPGIFWVEIAAAGLYVLCGCPADSVKHLRRMGLIADQERAVAAVQKVQAASASFVRAMFSQKDACRRAASSLEPRGQHSPEAACQQSLKGMSPACALFA